MSDNKVVKILYFTGIANWCKHHKRDQYNRYTVDVYLDDKSLEKYINSGIQSKIRENEDGKKYVTFKRDHSKLVGDRVLEFGPPDVQLADGKKFTGNVGNGSEVTVKVRVYDTAKGPGSSWESLRVDELVPYEGTVIEEDKDIDVPF